MVTEECRVLLKGLHRLGEATLCLSLLPGLVSVATEFWLCDVPSTHHVGLWQHCTRSSCLPINVDNTPDAYNAVRGLVVMAICLHIVSVVTGCCCKFMGDPKLHRCTCLSHLEEAAAAVAGVLTAVALGVFVRSSEADAVLSSYRLGWSFWLCVAYTLLLFVCSAWVGLVRNDCGVSRLCRLSPCKPPPRGKLDEQQKTTLLLWQLPPGEPLKLSTIPDSDPEADLDVCSPERPAFSYVPLRDAEAGDIFAERSA